MDFIKTITTPIENKIHKFNSIRYTQSRIRYFDEKRNEFVRKNNVPELPTHVADQIRKFWGKYVKTDIGLNFHRIAALRIPQDSLPYIVSESVLYPLLIKKLNPENTARTLANKGLYNILFADIKRPNEIVRNVNRNFLDSNNNLLCTEEAIEKILSLGSPLIIKKSTYSFGGRGVKILNEYNRTIIQQNFDLFKKDYVVQELLTQSQQTARFNPTSLNTFRVLTLLLNGRFSLLGAWLRCGAKDAHVDNLTSGGMAACIFPDGRLTYAIDFNVPRIDYSPTGLKFEDCHIEHFDRIIQKAEELHKRIPLIAMAGWDFALDTDDEPVFIEANLRSPDTWPWQMTQGPIFGDRLSEVLNY
jgi:hypothetical protein